MAKTISAGELERRLTDPGFVLIDVRPMAAFNGWRMQGESRGGHIPGAIPYPLQWTERMDPVEFKGYLESKGITAAKEIAIYGYAIDDGLAMLGKMEQLNYENCLLCEEGIIGWVADAERPVEHLPNYQKLIHADWLHALIATWSANPSRGKSFELFHVGDDVLEGYDVGHIPTAVYLDTRSLESAPQWNRISDQELQQRLPELGITHDKTIVLYGREIQPGPEQPSSSQHAGQTAAARAAVILMYAGVEDVRLLDGGLTAWTSAGFELETSTNNAAPADRFGRRVPAHPNYMVDIETVKAMLADPSGSVVSARSWSEFIGEKSGYHYLESKGRIAGAVWGAGMTDGYHVHPLRNLDNSMRSYRQIQESWLAEGITPGKHIAFYCGSGWRASDYFFCAHLMGWEQIALYDGGWLEWSQDESNSVERGPPPKVL